MQSLALTTTLAFGKLKQYRTALRGTLNALQPACLTRVEHTTLPSISTPSVFPQLQFYSAAMEAVTSVVNSHPYAAAALAVGIPSLVIAKNAARNYLLRTFTVLLDLPEVSKPRGSSKIQGTAVVCGGR